MSFHVLIPSRYASTRLPAKPLLEIGGKPMIRWVYERALESGAASVIVATEDERIRDACEAFGATVCMTSPHHRSGSERLAEVAEHLGYGEDDIVVNLQGDEPLVPPALLKQVADNLAAHSGASMATLCTRIEHAAELFDPNVVKVVWNREGYALYFSRAPIPWDRDFFANTRDALPEGSAHWRHLGIYAYRAGFLRRYVQESVCEIETRESLEQLRVLWAGHHIHVAEAVTTPGPGVDTPADLERVRQLIAGMVRA